MSRPIKIKIINLTDAENAWSVPQDFLSMLPRHLVATLGDDGDGFLLVGFTTPAIADNSLPWARTDQNGNWMGIHMFIQGEWRPAPTLPLGAVIGMHNLNVSDVPFGWKLCNGNDGTVDLTSTFKGAGPAFFEYAQIQFTGILAS